jgi:hypothetical protein
LLNSAPTPATRVARSLSRVAPKPWPHMKPHPLHGTCAHFSPLPNRSQSEDRGRVDSRSANDQGPPTGGPCCC